MPRFLSISKIEVLDRQRKSIEARSLSDLQDSILSKGLLQPIVVTKVGDKFRLIAGERRLRAITGLHQKKEPLYHEDSLLLDGTIPVVMLKESDTAALLEMELDENELRVNLTWQERCAALAAIEEAKRLSKPLEGSRGVQTEMAREIIAKQPEVSRQSLGAVRTHLTQSLTVAHVLASGTRPDLEKAKSTHEAYSIILREQAEKFEAEAARRALRKVKSETRIWDLKHGDLKKVLLTLPDGLVDLILVDPPYGIDINTEKFAAGTVHRYDDSSGYAIDLAIFILQEGWRLTKKRANVFMFCSLKHFYTLKTAAEQYGWSAWPSPIIWQKSQVEGASPWGRLGFLKTYEVFIYLTRGERGINGPIPDVIPIQKVAARSRVHGAEKPTALLEYLIEKSTSPGDLVLDPCAGSGSTLLAAVKKSRRSIGVELDETYFNRAMSRMALFESGKSDDQLENLL